MLTRAILEAPSAKAVRELLGEYADKAESVDTGPTMFGDEVPTATKEEVLRSLVDREQLDRARMDAAGDLREAVAAASGTLRASTTEDTSVRGSV